MKRSLISKDIEAEKKKASLKSAILSEMNSQNICSLTFPSQFVMWCLFRWEWFKIVVYVYRSKKTSPNELLPCTFFEKKSKYTTSPTLPSKKTPKQTTNPPQQTKPRSIKRSSLSKDWKYLLVQRNWIAVTKPLIPQSTKQIISL